MKTTTPSLTYFGVYSPAFRQQVHQLLVWGYQAARHSIESDDEKEPSITGFIARAIRERYSTIGCPRWCTHYVVRDDPPVEKEGKSGVSRPRADLIIESSLRGHPEYIFEAKRLRKSSHGTDKYIGADGMGCFISGLYASRYDEAAMLGYVQSDSLELWCGKVKGAIGGESAQLCLRLPQRDAQVVEALPLEWVSEHDRDSVGRSIAIYHILLDCRI